MFIRTRDRELTSWSKRWWNIMKHLRYPGTKNKSDARWKWGTVRHWHAKARRRSSRGSYSLFTTTIIIIRTLAIQCSISFAVFVSIQTSVKRATSISSKLSGLFHWQLPSPKYTRPRFLFQLEDLSIVIYRNIMSIASFSKSTFRLLVESRGYTLIVSI